MTISIALLVIGSVALVLGLLAGSLSPALAGKRGWLLIAGVACLVLGLVLDPDFMSGLRDGLRGE